MCAWLPVLCFNMDLVLNSQHFLANLATWLIGALTFADSVQVDSVCFCWWCYSVFILYSIITLLSSKALQQAGYYVKKNKSALIQHTLFTWQTILFADGTNKEWISIQIDLLRYSKTLTVIIAQKDIIRTVEVHFFLNTGILILPWNLWYRSFNHSFLQQDKNNSHPSSFFLLVQLSFLKYWLDEPCHSVSMLLSQVF